MIISFFPAAPAVFPLFAKFLHSLGPLQTCGRSFWDIRSPVSHFCPLFDVFFSAVSARFALSPSSCTMLPFEFRRRPLTLSFTIFALVCPIVFCSNSIPADVTNFAV